MQDSCAPIADALSCDAQIMLAKREVSNNTYLWDYSVNHPACHRMHELMDRDTESGMIMSVGSSKKLCIDRRPSFADGPWKEQFQSLLGDSSPIYVKYDQWTKAK